MILVMADYTRERRMRQRELSTDQKEEKGEKQKALKDYQQAADLSPGDKRIAYRLAFAYREAGEETMSHK